MNKQSLDLINKADYRHVLGISGGKDSAALAIYMKEKYPEIHERMEYFFCDTGAELDEVKTTLESIEVYLGKKIIRLNSEKGFDEWLDLHNQYLPSAKQRWCTRVMKIEPFEKYIGTDDVISYVGIRADENRKGYISTKENVHAIFPFIEDRLVRDDIYRILENSIGIPKYYDWRSRSGCYFCFFQQQKEWLGLKRRHPDLFEKAKAYESRQKEKFDWYDQENSQIKGNGFTWSSRGTLDEIVVLAEEAEKRNRIIASSSFTSWQETLENLENDEPDDQACIICSL
jgi:3'-phosphoadenosine 5'-phosphosulfate sulfotransferase (PAPS reductase)/FAD synthetase